MTGDTKVANAVLLLVRHALFHKHMYGYLPDHRYMMTMFEIPFEFAEHVLYVAALVSNSKVRK